MNPLKSGEEEVHINFNDEPNKSNRQIEKIIELIEQNVETRNSLIQKL